MTTLARAGLREEKMKAVLCKEFGPPETLIVEDIPSPEPGPGRWFLMCMPLPSISPTR